MTRHIYDSDLLVSILDAAVDAIIVADEIGDIVRTNLAATRLFGYSNEEMLGCNVKMLMPESMAVQHDGFMSRHIETGEKRIIGIGRDVYGQRKDGSTFPLHLSVGKAEVDGKFAFIGILHDQTVRKATEAALERSQRMDAIGQMTGGIAHDFNNLLTVIMGNLELMQMRMQEMPGQELLQDALDAAELGSELTSRLMVFARKSPLKSETININDVVDRSLILIKRTIGTQFTLRTDLEDVLWSADIDPIQLQTSILNLAINAKDAMPSSGSIGIETTNIRIDDTYVAQETDILPGNYVRISVTDTGIGMSETERKRALEPFFTTKPTGKGTGLGLSMVYGFTKQSGGQLTLYSEPDQGTTISLYFPAILDASATDLASAAIHGDEFPKGNDETVLVVDDNIHVLRLTCERVKDLGYTCLSAASADDAYEMLHANSEIDILLTDIVMPGSMNGFELAKKVSKEFPDIRTLLTTGYAEELMQANGHSGNGFALLRKPYRQREIAIALRKLLEDS